MSKRRLPRRAAAAKARIRREDETLRKRRNRGRDTAAPIRGYSTEFALSAGDAGAAWVVSKVPTAIWTDVKDKCAREGISVRHLFLTFARAWARTP